MRALLRVSDPWKHFMEFVLALVKALAQLRSRNSYAGRNSPEDTSRGVQRSLRSPLPKPRQPAKRRSPGTCRNHARAWQCFSLL